MLKSMRISVPRQILISLISLHFLAGCVSASRWQCLPGEQEAINDLLYFGTAKPNGSVSTYEWADFLRLAVTPRFPKGFTVWSATGQWQGKGSALVSENSFVLNFIHPDDEASEKAVLTIAAAYKRRFQQEAVLRVKGFACVSH